MFDLLTYAGILIVWDRLFGTFQGETERVRYGLTKNVDTHNPARVAFHEYASIANDVRHARSWRERLGYAFGGPGWTRGPSAGVAGGDSVEHERQPGLELVGVTSGAG